MSARFGLLALALAWVLAGTAAAAVVTAVTAGPAAPASSPVLGADGQPMAPDIARLIARGELVVAMSSVDSPPFFTEVKGVLSGIDVDLARAIGDELKLRVRFERSVANNDATVALVGSGRADLAIGRLGRTLRRSQMVLFSAPYLSLRHAMLVHRAGFARLADGQPLNVVLREFRGQIGVLGNSSWQEYARLNFPLARVTPYPTWEAVVAAVRAGKEVAGYSDELGVRNALAADPGLALTVRSVTFDDAHEGLTVMVGVGDSTLLSFVNEVIAARVERIRTAAVLKRDR